MPKAIFALRRKPVTLLGAILAALAAVLIVLLSLIALAGHGGGLWLQLIAYALLPALLVFAVVVMLLGLWWQRRRERRAAAGGAAPPLPVVDLNDRATRRTLLAALLLAGVGLVILAGAGLRGVNVLESPTFCTQACHTIMQPEATSHARSAHANVTCAECHIGPGLKWFVKSKINGTLELIEIAENATPRPIPAPIHNLRAARIVCEQCHSAREFIADRLIVRTHYGEDAANTPVKTVLMLHVGGDSGGASSGAHWHASHANQVRYLADPTRETVYAVELTTAGGKPQTFKTDAAPPAAAQWRTMDCVDCHNRAAHPFGTPAAEVDAALADGRIDSSLPFIKREALRVLKAEYPSQNEARMAISREITSFYGTNYADQAESHATAVKAAGKTLGDLWAANVFPQMKVTWNTYVDQLGHQQSPGCLRCHDNKHVAADGAKISKSCGLCHHVVAEDEAAPEALKALE